MPTPKHGQHAENEELQLLKKKVALLNDVCVRQRIVIAQLTDNEGNLHELLGIAEQRLASAELVIGGEAFSHPDIGEEIPFT
jgi:hypothetical protein